MPLHADTIRAILNNWNTTKYNGSQDVRPWLMEVEEKCRIYGIQEAQMTEVAVKCTEGEANPVLTAMFKAKVDKAGVWPWADFKKCLIGIEDNYRQNLKDAPQNAEDGDFRSQHPYAAAALGVTLVGVGAVLVLPAVGVAILGAVGFGSGGVAAGSLAAFLQSVIYGGATGGVFSVCQSLAATAVVCPLATVAGSELAAAGAWLSGGRRDREEPAAAER